MFSCTCIRERGQENLMDKELVSRFSRPSYRQIPARCMQVLPGDNRGGVSTVLHKNRLMVAWPCNKLDCKFAKQIFSGLHQLQQFQCFILAKSEGAAGQSLDQAHNTAIDATL